MKSLLKPFFVVILIASFNAKADLEKELAQSKNLFKTLVSWHDTGRNTKFSEIENKVFEGRCFWYEEPNSPYYSIAYAFRNNLSGIDNGPAFGNELPAQLLLAPTDEYTFSLSKKSARLMALDYLRNNPNKVDDNPPVSMQRNMHGGLHQDILRWKGNYLLSVRTVFKAGEEPRKSAACYFFNPR